MKRSKGLQRTTRLRASGPIRPTRPACDCSHEADEHTTGEGACLVCACTWYHPNGRSVRRALARRKRSASEFARIYGSDERIAWLKQQPCVVMGCGRGPCEVAHTENGGTGRKADACHTVPLCRTHHRESHVLGIRTFEAMHRLDLEAEARRVDATWRKHLEAA